MAPVFSRSAWRCTWHLIQVNFCLWSIQSARHLNYFKYFLWSPHLHPLSQTLDLFYINKSTWLLQISCWVDESIVSSDDYKILAILFTLRILDPFKISGGKYIFVSVVAIFDYRVGSSSWLSFIIVFHFFHLQNNEVIYIYIKLVKQWKQVWEFIYVVGFSFARLCLKLYDTCVTYGVYHGEPCFMLCWANQVSWSLSLLDLSPQCILYTLPISLMCNLLWAYT